MAEVTGARPAVVFTEDGLLMRVVGCPTCGALVEEGLAWSHEGSHLKIAAVLAALGEVETLQASLAAEGQRLLRAQQWTADLIAFTRQLVQAPSTTDPPPRERSDRRRGGWNRWTKARTWARTSTRSSL